MIFSFGFLLTRPLESQTWMWISWFCSTTSKWRWSVRAQIFKPSSVLSCILNRVTSKLKHALALLVVLWFLKYTKKTGIVSLLSDASILERRLSLWIWMKVGKINHAIDRTKRDGMPTTLRWRFSSSSVSFFFYRSPKWLFPFLNLQELLLSFYQTY